MFYFLYCMIQVNEPQPHTPPPILFFTLRVEIFGGGV